MLGKSPKGARAGSVRLENDVSWTAAALLAALLAGCAASSDGEDSADPGGTPADEPGDPDDPRFEDDDDPPPADEPDPGADDPTGPVVPDIDPPEEGDVVAQLELELPGHEQFVLRGTLPVPKDVHPRPDGQVALAVVDHDGTPLPSQVEAVTWYPDADDGADVVEVLALVSADPALQKGDRTRYDVVFSPHPAPDVDPADGLDALATVTHAVPPSVVSLLGDPGDLVVRAKDCFGNVYEARPLESPHQTQRRSGRAVTQLTAYADMLPVAPKGGSQGTLPHLFGVHAYVSTWSGQSALGFDLRFHNGHVDLQGGSQDDALGRVYFEDLEVVVPLGWQVEQAFPDPMLGDAYTEGSTKVFPLVKPLAGGKMHLMPWQAQFHRRLAVRPNGAAPEAGELLEQQGLAFCVRGDSPTTGEPLYSWWNPGTARYFQQRSLLPSLDHVGLAGLRNALKNDFEDLAQVVATGFGDDSYPLVAEDLGWAHPWGVEYGGMTGGDEIQFFEGVETAAAASTEGYRYFEVLHRMQTDRQPMAAFRSDGAPTSVEDWLESSPLPHVPFEYFLLAAGNSDPFGVNDAPSFQVDHVVGTGKKPPYQNQLLAFGPHDFQHYSRYTRAPMALAWLGNDMLSKDDLLLAAEVFRLSFHQYANNPGGGLQGSGMKAKIQSVQSQPGVGTTLGRGEGHGLVAVNSAYAFDPSWRVNLMPWYEALVELASDAQTPCSGFVQSMVISKGLDGKYKVRQCIEQHIFDNGVRGAWKTALEGVAPAHEALARDFLESSFYGSISALAWQPGHNEPWSWTAVAPLSGSPYCDAGELPPDWHETYHEGHNIWSSFGYAYELTGDTVFFTFAGKAAGGSSNPLGALTSDGLKNIDNRAATLAALQLSAGQL